MKAVGKEATIDNALPLQYKISAIWGAHEGSFLLWSLVMAGWTLAVSVFSGYAKLVGQWELVAKSIEDSDSLTAKGKREASEEAAAEFGAKLKKLEAWQHEPPWTRSCQT